MKLDILVIASHPDDAELCCSGTVAKEIALGKNVGLIDLTRGELGTRGDAETRQKEAGRSAEILGVSVRENLCFEDGFFLNDREHQLAIIKRLRKYQPEIVLTNAPEDRHPDHGRASLLVKDACFLSGLIKIETVHEGIKQDAHRPNQVYHFIQNNYVEPDFVVDISDYWEQKISSVKAFASQFYNPESDEPESFISSKSFMHFVESRAREMGHKIGAEFGEGFVSDKMLGVRDLFDLI